MVTCGVAYEILACRYYAFMLFLWVSYYTIWFSLDGIVWSEIEWIGISVREVLFCIVYLLTLRC